MSGSLSKPDELFRVSKTKLTSILAGPWSQKCQHRPFVESSYPPLWTLYDHFERHCSQNFEAIGFLVFWDRVYPTSGCKIVGVRPFGVFRGRHYKEISSKMFNRLIELFTDPFDMVRGLRSSAGGGLNVWGPSLLAPQAVGGLIWINRPEGSVVLLGLVIMLITVGYIHRHEPLSRLIGVGQAWWLLSAPWLLFRAIGQEAPSIFSFWLWYVAITMIVSIVMSAYGFHLFLTSDNQTYEENN